MNLSPPTNQSAICTARVSGARVHDKIIAGRERRRRDLRGAYIYFSFAPPRNMFKVKRGRAQKNEMQSASRTTQSFFVSVPMHVSLSLLAKTSASFRLAFPSDKDENTHTLKPILQYWRRAAQSERPDQTFQFPGWLNNGCSHTPGFQFSNRCSSIQPAGKCFIYCFCFQVPTTVVSWW